MSGFIGKIAEEVRSDQQTPYPYVERALSQKTRNPVKSFFSPLEVLLFDGPKEIIDHIRQFVCPRLLDILDILDILLLSLLLESFPDLFGV
jgi:hypothetical protein